jgi:hypothetical protein
MWFSFRAFPLLTQSGHPATFLHRTLLRWSKARKCLLLAVRLPLAAHPMWRLRAWLLPWVRVTVFSLGTAMGCSVRCERVLGSLGPS